RAPPQPVRLLSRRCPRRPNSVQGLEQALLDLQLLTERLRRDCPWDREQTTRTIVPHTVEEAYEVADAALAGDDDKLLDELRELQEDLGSEERRAEELGDVLFAAVNVARKLDVDPELELRRASERFRSRVESAELLARENGEDWSALPLERQDHYFDLAKEYE